MGYSMFIIMRIGTYHYKENSLKNYRNNHHKQHEINVNLGPQYHDNVDIILVVHYRRQTVLMFATLHPLKSGLTSILYSKKIN